jgi:hypothetical protein
MQVSAVGLLVCVGLLLLGYCLRAPLIVALLASLAFGTTAVVTLDSLGSSSPLIFILFAFLFSLSVLARKTTLHELGALLAKSQAAWIVCSLTVYAWLSAALLPRLFAGQTNAFVPARAAGRIVEVPLGPVPGNITQTAYFALGAITFLALSVFLAQGANLIKIRRSFFAWCILHAGLGMADLAGKLVGAGDILDPIRTANYTLLTEDEAAGFSRIAGGYSEASGFGTATLACLAFTFTYWRRTRSSIALALSIVLLFLLVICTSTTAYVGVTIISLPLVISLGRSALAGRLYREDLLLLALVLLVIVTVLSIDLYNERQFDPLVQLFETTVLNKSLSLSAQERTYWNLVSLQSFVDTLGLGVGFGSSRSSGWIIAVISQIGLLGTLMVGALVMELWRDVGRNPSTQIERETIAIHDSARACALAWLVGSAVGGGTADPGLLFFITLATVLACRTHLRQFSAGGQKVSAPALQFG